MTISGFQVPKSRNKSAFSVIRVKIVMKKW